MRNQHEASSLMSIADVAALYGVNEKTVRRRVADGHLKAYRLGGKLLRFKREDVDALLTRVPTFSPTR